MAVLGEKIADLRQALEPLDERADDLPAELRRCTAGIEEALEAMRGDERRRAEALT
jgi:hypothetical protein